MPEPLDPPPLPPEPLDPPLLPPSEPPESVDPPLEPLESVDPLLSPVQSFHVVCTQSSEEEVPESVDDVEVVSPLLVLEPDEVLVEVPVPPLVLALLA